MNCKIFWCERQGCSVCCADCGVENCANRCQNGPERCGAATVQPVSRRRQSRVPAEDIKKE